MYRNIKFLAVLYVLLFLANNLLTGASIPSTLTNNSFKAVITGTDNKPVEGAVVMNNKGIILATTSNDGSFSADLADQSEILIVAEGYNNKTVYPQELKNPSIELSALPASQKGRTPLAFGSMTQDQIVGAVTVLDAMRFCVWIMDRA